MDMYKKREMRKNKKLEGSNDNKNTINWYPGHMAKTKREIKESLNLVDIVFEIVDSRMPVSSRVVDLDELIGNKPRIIIMTKYDLCDKSVTDKFICELEKNYKVIKANLKNNGSGLKNELVSCTSEVLKELSDRNSAKGLKSRAFRALVVGCPNVGKSTLINYLSGRNAVQTGNRAGVTKSLSWINVNKDLLLLDTPGILYPKISDRIVGYNLASLSSIKEEILDREDICKYILKFLLDNYPILLNKRYGIDNIDFDEIEYTFDDIGKKRGCLLRGGIVDYDKVFTIILNDLKDGSIGLVTFDK